MPQVGYENYLYINTGTSGSPIWTEVDLTRDVSKNRDKSEVDATSRSTARNGWKATEDGLKSMGVEFESLKPAPDETNAAFTALEEAFEDNGSVEALLAEGPIDSGSAVPAVKAVCGVFGGNESQPLEDMTTVSYTLKNKQTPVKGTVSGGVFSES